MIEREVSVSRWLRSENFGKKNDPDHTADLLIVMHANSSRDSHDEYLRRIAEVWLEVVPNRNMCQNDSDIFIQLFLTDFNNLLPLTSKSPPSQQLLSPTTPSLPASTVTHHQSHKHHQRQENQQNRKDLL
jgi:hypothetical protein